MKKTVRDYYQVCYNWKFGGIGIMGKEHNDMQGAIEQINFLVNQPDHDERRDYFIRHIVETKESEDIKYPVYL